MPDALCDYKIMCDLKKYTGCFIGLAAGDTWGARYEGGLVERSLWMLIGKTRDGRRRFTDDTQMSIDLARAFLDNGAINQDHLAKTFADSYRWSRGYGPGAARLLKSIKKGADWRNVNRAQFNNGSFGNGAAMRAPILALCFPKDLDALKQNVIRSSEITHAHPLAIEAAQLVALATRGALHDRAVTEVIDDLSRLCDSDIYRKKMAFCIDALNSDRQVAVKEIRRRLGNGIAATESSVTAIYLAMKNREHDLLTMFAQIRELGGDTDTIAAMSGAIWGAFNGAGAIGQECIDHIEQSTIIIDLAHRLYAKAHPVEGN